MASVSRPCPTCKRVYSWDFDTFADKPKKSVTSMRKADAALDEAISACLHDQIIQDKAKVDPTMRINLEKGVKVL